LPNAHYQSPTNRLEHSLVHNRPTNRLPTTPTHRNLLRSPTQKGGQIMTIPITTNLIAREHGIEQERKRTHYAIEAHKAMIVDRINQTHSELIKQAFTITIIELEELQRTLKETK